MSRDLDSPVGLESRVAAIVDGLRRPQEATFTTRYHEKFVASGIEKATKILHQLGADHPKLDLARCAYFSVGGSDGSEIETVMRNSPIRFGVLLEYDPVVIPTVFTRAENLAEIGKTLKIEIGDATMRMPSCRDHVLHWRKQGEIDGLICSVQAVLHELPARSPNFDIDNFFGTMLWNFVPCLLYMREPCRPVGWPDQVKLRIPELSSDRLAELAKQIAAYRAIQGRVLTAGPHFVTMSSMLAAELLSKLFYLEDYPHEIQEQVTWIDPERLVRKVTEFLGANSVVSEPVASDSFSRYYRSFGVETRDVDGNILEMPRPFVRIVGARLQSESGVLAGPPLAESVTRTHEPKWTDSQPTQPAAGHDIKELLLSDFEVGPLFAGHAVEFLQGRSPSPSTAVHAAVPRAIANSITNLAKSFDILVVHGAIGEGTSTVLMQSAFQAINQGRRVFRLGSPDALQNCKKLLPWAERPLVVLDDAHRLTALPSWLRQGFPDDLFGCLVFGIQTRRRSELSRVLSTCPRSCREIQVPPVRPEHAPSYIELIKTFHAAPEELTNEQIGDLFRDGLSLRHGLSGLWPAQYQATRGILLDERFNRLLSAMDVDEKRALSLLTFLQFVSNNSPSHPPPSNLQTLRGMLDTIEPSIDQAAINRCVGALFKLSSALEGELRHGFSAEDTQQLENFTLEFRHPAVTESIFRFCFGAADPARGSFRFAKWPLYSALARALPAGSNSAGWIAYSVLLRMQSDTRWDYYARGELKRRLTSDDFPRIGDRILRAIDEVRSFYGTSMTDGGQLSRRIDIIEVQALTEQGRPRSPEDLTRAEDRLTAALANAFVENDHTVLRYAAWSAQDIGYVRELSLQGESKKVDWKLLIATAEILEAKDSKKRPTRSAEDYLSLLLRERDSKYLQDLLSIIERSELLTNDDVRENTRLLRLRSILKWVRRTDGKNRAKYLIPKQGRSGVAVKSVQSLYVAFWRELRRKDETDPNFKRLSCFRESTGSLMGDIIKPTFEEWFDDFEEDDECWPSGVIDAVGRARDDFREWLPLIRSYDNFFPELRDRPQ